MKKYLAFLLIMACLPLAAKKDPVRIVTPASCERIVYVGRTLVEGDQVSLDWSGSYLRIAFRGDYLAMKVSDSKKNYYNVWLDAEPGPEADKVISTFGKDSLVVLYDEAAFKSRYGKKGPEGHTVCIQKRTEGEQGLTTFSSFITAGEILQAEPIRPRVIEFIGDSYTCGYGSENSIATDPFKPETENQNKTYAAIAGRYFDADIYVIAHSGMGIIRNYNSKLKGYTMVQRYLNVFDNGFDEVPQAPKWSADRMSVKPAITVIYLGANDFSISLQPIKKAFIKNYITLLKEIKDFYGEDHPILCLSAKRDPELGEYVRDAALESGMKNVEFLGFSPAVHSSSELGASSHPSYAGHRKLAYAVIPYIATMTGWPLTDKPVK